MVTGFVGCQEGLFHIDIHRLCGYRQKCYNNPILKRDLSVGRLFGGCQQLARKLQLGPQLQGLLVGLLQAFVGT